MASSSIFFVLLSLLAVAAVVAQAHLSSDFYAKSCPSALSTIQSGVKAAVSKEARMGASLLRLHFHDCFVNGCDGSVLLDDTASMKGEKEATPNHDALRGFDVIDDIKSKLEKECPGVISCADIVAVAARDSVVALGGPAYTVQLGRRDSTTASKDAAEKNLPIAYSPLEFIMPLFARKGLNTQDLVALSGGHTIGKGRCRLVRPRIHLKDVIDPKFALSLRRECPFVGGDDNLLQLDETPAVFDNNMFKNLLTLRGVLHTDQLLFSNATTAPFVEKYSKDSAAFFSDFGKAMIKMGNIEVLTGENGEIRTNCRKVNQS